MGPPSTCPYTSDELVKLSREVSLPELVEHTHKHHGQRVAISTIFRWRKAFDIHDIKRRQSKPKPPPKKSWRIIDCPYSVARLNEMYWRERMSVVEIGQHAAKVLGREVVSENAVDRWLTQAGIHRRTCAQAQKIRALKNPKQMRDNMQKARTLCKIQNSHNFTMPSAAKEYGRSSNCAAREQSGKTDHIRAHAGPSVASPLLDNLASIRLPYGSVVEGIQTAIF